MKPNAELSWHDSIEKISGTDLEWKPMICTPHEVQETFSLLGMSQTPTGYLYTKKYRHVYSQSRSEADVVG
jgi:hypothetical protein